MATDILSLDEMTENQSAKYLTHNTALRQIEAMFVRVLSRTNSGPPVSPSNGDVYIVDSAADGWSTADVNDIAHYYSGAWHFYSPVTNHTIWCVDENVRLRYSGSAWVYALISRVDLNVTLADLGAVGFVDTMTVDTNGVGVGAALCLSADGHLDEADADALATMRCMGLALATGTGEKEILRWGKIRNDAWSWTPGSPLFVSATQGVLTHTAPSGSGQFVQVVGEAEASNIIMFAPSYDVIEIA